MNEFSFGLDPKTAKSFDNFYQATNRISKELKAGSDTAIKAIGDAFEIGAESYAKTLSEAAKKHSKSLNEDYKKIHETEKALQDLEAKANDELRKTQDDNQKKQIREKLEQERKGLQRELAKRKDLAERLSGRASREFERQQVKTLARIEEQQKILKEANEASAKLMRTHIQEGLEFGGERLSEIISLSQEDFVKGISSAFNKIGTVASRAAARGLESRALAGKDNSGAMGQVLTALTKIGPVLIGVTAAFAGLAALAFAADGQVREFNKTILEAAPAVDLFGKTVFDSGFNLKTSLKEIRDAAIDFSDITKVSAQDALNLITKFNDSGIALSQLRSEFSKTGNATEAYTEMAIFANTYTRALGISVDELTTHFGNMFGKMGMGLDSIKDSFGAITAGAQVAGLNVKDFFTAVSQTTSGLALYNIRLDKTAAQLLGLMKIMDKQKAQELLESKEMGGQGIEERFKAGMLVGGRGQKIFQAALKDQMANFTKDYGETFAETLGEIDMSELAKMSGKELGSLQQALIAEGGRKGLAPEQATMAGQRLEKLRKTAQGAQGGAMGMAKGMSGLSGLSDVAMRLTQGMSLVGAQSLDDMGYIARKSFEELSGISGEKFDEMASLLNRYQAQFPKDTIPQILERMASGEVPMTDADKKLFDEVSKQKPASMEQLAQEQINATTSITDILKNKIAGLLEYIGSALSDIFDGFAESSLLDFGGGKKKREEREAVKGEIKGFKEESSALTEKIKKIEAGIAEEKARPEDKQAKKWIESQQNLVEQMKAEQAGLARKVELGEKTLEGISKGKSKQDVEKELLGVKDTKLVETDMSRAGLGGPMEFTKSQDEITAELVASREQNAKAASDQYIEDKKREEEAKKQEKLQKELNETVKKSNARTQLMQTYDKNAVLAAMGGNVGALKKAIGRDKGGLQLASEAGIKLQDFIYRGDGTRGTINPINKRDEFFGAKPGGAIDKAINGGGGVVNIYISGDEAKVYNVVKRVIQESGLRAPAGGR